MTGIISLGIDPDAKSKFAGESNLLSRTETCWICGKINLELRAVVDVGRSNRLGVRAASFDPDVLVLTHDDSDHIGDAEAFFAGLSPERRGPRNSPRELWIPYEWGLMMRALRSYGDSLSNHEDGSDLELGPSDIVRVIGPGVLERDLGSDAGNEADWIPLPGVTALRPFTAANESELLDGELPIESIDKERLQTDIAVVLTSRQETQPELKIGSPDIVAERAVKSASVIASILANATSLGMGIRFFSVDDARGYVSDLEPLPWEYAGLPGELTIVNAVQVHIAPVRVREPALSIALLARVSVQNRRALVTFLWPECGTGKAGVLVWSDSTGESARVATSTDMVPWEMVSVMTAPHHGSPHVDHNAIWRGWEAQQDAGNRIKVVVSGDIRPPHNRIGQCFLDVSQSDRACTMCRHMPGSRNIGTVRAVSDRYGSHVAPSCMSTCT